MKNLRFVVRDTARSFDEDGVWMWFTHEGKAVQVTVKDYDKKPTGTLKIDVFDGSYDTCIKELAIFKELVL